MNKDIRKEIIKIDLDNFEKAKSNYMELYDDGYMQILNDLELEDFLKEYGFGETVFHTANIERLLLDKRFWMNKYIDLLIEVKNGKVL